MFSPVPAPISTTRPRALPRSVLPPAAHACDLAQPEKRVVHQGENPQPRRGRRAHREFGACVSRSCRERTSGRIVRASLGAAIFRRWPLPAISQESETRGLRDGGRPRGATQLAADVRDVAVNGMRAQHELLCDLAIARDPARRRRGSHAHDWTAGPAPARSHRAATAAPVPALRGTRGRRNPRHRARGSARSPAAG